MTLPIVMLISPNYYWLFLLVASLIVGGIGIALFVFKSKQANQIQIALRDLGDGLNEMGDRSMENRTQINHLIRQSSNDELAQSYSDLLARADLDYSGKWFPNPEPLAVAIKNDSNYTKLGNNSAQIPALVGLLATIILIVCQNFLTGSNAMMLSSSLFPFLLGGLLFYLINSSVGADRESIDYSISRIIDRLRLILPVYSDEAASSLLVENFVNYNKNLSDSAKELVAAEVILGVSESLEELLKRDVVPSLTASSRTISDLAGNLAQEQDNKMEELAASFSEQLSSRLGGLFEPIAAQVGGYSAMMAENQERVSEALSAFTSHRESLELITSEVQISLNRLQTERDGWQSERQSLNSSLANLTEAGDRLTDLQNTAAGVLAERMDAMGLNLDQFAASTSAALEKLAQVNDQMETLLRDTNHEHANTVSDYRLLSDEIKTAAKNMEQSNGLLAMKMSDLNASLAHSLGGFGEQIQTQVNGTLEDFDKGLAEMSLRLSHSVTEIRDTANSITRLSSESRHRAPVGALQKADD